MKRMRSCILLLCGLLMIIEFSACVSKSTVNIPTAKALLQNIDRRYPGVQRIELYYFPASYCVTVVLSPLCEKEMEAIADEIKDMAMSEEFLKEYKADAVRFGNSTPEIEVGFYGGGWLWYDKQPKYIYTGFFDGKIGFTDPIESDIPFSRWVGPILNEDYLKSRPEGVVEYSCPEE